MALLLRMAGIPARVATGFTPGPLRPATHQWVRDLDAHSWVEAYFPAVRLDHVRPDAGRVARASRADAAAADRRPPRAVGDPAAAAPCRGPRRGRAATARRGRLIAPAGRGDRRGARGARPAARGWRCFSGGPRRAAGALRARARAAPPDAPRPGTTLHALELRFAGAPAARATCARCARAATAAPGAAHRARSAAALRSELGRGARVCSAACAPGGRCRRGAAGALDAPEPA